MKSSHALMLLTFCANIFIVGAVQAVPGEVVNVSQQMGSAAPKSNGVGSGAAIKHELPLAPSPKTLPVPRGGAPKADELKIHELTSEKKSTESVGSNSEEIRYEKEQIKKTSAVKPPLGADWDTITIPNE